MQFRNWFEMAIDMSGFDDPFEPEFHKSISKKKAIVYHGTTTKYFWNIVKEGFTFNPDRKNYQNTTPGVYFSFTPTRASNYAWKTVDNVGGTEIIFVAEVPIKMLQPDIDDKDGADKESKIQAMSGTPVPAKYLTNVIFEDEEMPIKKFINKVNKGKIPEIEPNEVSGRFSRESKPDLEYAVLSYLQDLCNYCGFLDYIIAPNQHTASQKIVKELHNMQWSQYSSWNGEQWVAWLEKVFGAKSDEDYYKTQPEFQMPLYRVITKYRYFK